MLFMPRSAAAEEIAADVRRTALAIQACPSMVDKQRHYEIEAERAKRFNAHFGIRPAPVLTPVAGKPHFFTNERGQLSYCPPLPPTTEESAAQQKTAPVGLAGLVRNQTPPLSATHRCIYGSNDGTYYKAGNTARAFACQPGSQDWRPSRCYKSTDLDDPAHFVKL